MFGGVAVLVRRPLVLDARCDLVDVVPGRVCTLRVTSPAVALEMCSVHLFDEDGGAVLAQIRADASSRRATALPCSTERARNRSFHGFETRAKRLERSDVSPNRACASSTYSSLLGLGHDRAHSSCFLATATAA